MSLAASSQQPATWCTLAPQSPEGTAISSLPSPAAAAADAGAVAAALGALFGSSPTLTAGDTRIAPALTSFRVQPSILFRLGLRPPLLWEEEEEAEAVLVDGLLYLPFHTGSSSSLRS
jgi:hypothetical protein